MNIAEFVGRMREQADRIEGFAKEAAEASESKRWVCFYFISCELDTLRRRIDRTSEWLEEQEGSSDA